MKSAILHCIKKEVYKNLRGCWYFKNLEVQEKWARSSNKKGTSKISIKTDFPLGKKIREVQIKKEEHFKIIYIFFLSKNTRSSN